MTKDVLKIRRGYGFFFAPIVYTLVTMFGLFSDKRLIAIGRLVIPLRDFPWYIGSIFLLIGIALLSYLYKEAFRKSKDYILFTEEYLEIFADGEKGHFKWHQTGNIDFGKEFGRGYVLDISYQEIGFFEYKRIPRRHAKRIEGYIDFYKHKRLDYQRSH